MSVLLLFSLFLHFVYLKIVRITCMYICVIIYIYSMCSIRALSKEIISKRNTLPLSRVRLHKDTGGNLARNRNYFALL